MITLFCNRQIRALIHVGRFSNSTPRSITQVQYSFCVWSPVKQRMRPLVCVIVMLENGIHVVPFKKRRPVPSIFLAGPQVAFCTFKCSVRWVCRHMIDNEHIWAVLSRLQRSCKPVGLSAADWRRVVRVKKYQRHVLAEIQRRVTRIREQPVEYRIKKRRLLPRLAIAANGFVISNAGNQRYEPLTDAQVARIVLEEIKETIRMLPMF